MQAGVDPGLLHRKEGDDSVQEGVRGQEDRNRPQPVCGTGQPGAPGGAQGGGGQGGEGDGPKEGGCQEGGREAGGGAAKQARRSDVKATTRKANPVHKATTTAATRATPSRNGRQSAPTSSSSGSTTKKAASAKTTATRTSTAKKPTTAQGKAATAGAKATKPVTTGTSRASASSTKVPPPTAAPGAAASAAGTESAGAPASTSRPVPTRGTAPAPASATGSIAESAHGPTTNGSRAAASETRPSPARPYQADAKFLEEQRQALLDERAVYVGQAADLKAEADSLAADREPGDVQFDEESGEGGTFTVDRERDLALSAQALAAVEEIDAALDRIGLSTYGACERCQQPIPKSRLRALPYARLCVACKSGGLSRR